jgi:mRNA interferase RelE/StbE
MIKLKLSKSAIKFLDNLSQKEQIKIKQKLKYLVERINDSNNIPFQELNIKTLTGDWKGYLRLRIGKIRVIFRINPIDNELFIYEIDYRGGVYKKN